MVGLSSLQLDVLGFVISVPKPLTQSSFTESFTSVISSSEFLIVLIRFSQFSEGFTNGILHYLWEMLSRSTWKNVLTWLYLQIHLFYVYIQIYICIFYLCIYNFTSYFFELLCAVSNSVFPFDYSLRCISMYLRIMLWRKSSIVLNVIFYIFQYLTGYVSYQYCG